MNEISTTTWARYIAIDRAARAHPPAMLDCVRTIGRSLSLAILVTLAAPTMAAQADPALAMVDTCFVPAEPCVGRIVAAIDRAEHAIRVEAYGFSSKPILDALLRGKGRQIDVQVILDRSDEAGQHRPLDILREAGIPVWIDRAPGIAHIKTIIIDQHLDISGSYNYTSSAETRNVEDVTFTDSAEIANRFLHNWLGRRDAPTTTAVPP